MSRMDLTNVRAEALFVSDLQRSEDVTPDRVRAAVRDTVRRYGVNGLAPRVAEEFGEHPDIAVGRMNWCLCAIQDAYAPDAHAA